MMFSLPGLHARVAQRLAGFHTGPEIIAGLCNILLTAQPKTKAIQLENP